MKNIFLLLLRVLTLSMGVWFIYLWVSLVPIIIDQTSFFTKESLLFWGIGVVVFVGHCPPIYWFLRGKNE